MVEQAGGGSPVITEICPKTVACQYVEEELTAAIKRGATQYVAIGRSCEIDESYFPGDMRVFSVEGVVGEPVSSRLDRAGFGASEITLVSWLGGSVSTPHEVFSTLRMIASLPPSSAVIFDYAVCRRRADVIQQTAMDALASHVGDPPSRYIDPRALQTLLHASGFREIQEISAESGTGTRLVRALV
jgi:hypothetical protein